MSGAINVFVLQCVPETLFIVQSKKFRVGTFKNNRKIHHNTNIYYCDQLPVTILDGSWVSLDHFNLKIITVYIKDIPIILYLGIPYQLIRQLFIEINLAAFMI